MGWVMQGMGPPTGSSAATPTKLVAAGRPQAEVGRLDQNMGPPAGSWQQIHEAGGG